MVNLSFGNQQHAAYNNLRTLFASIFCALKNLENAANWSAVWSSALQRSQKVQSDFVFTNKRFQAVQHKLSKSGMAQGPEKIRSDYFYFNEQF